MKVDKHLDGATSWMDLSTPDLEGSALFYGGLFGWDAPEGPPEVGGYRQAVLDGEVVAGLGPKMMPEQPTAWTPYIQTSDIDGTVDKATSLGATVLAPKMEVMDFGHMAIVKDPIGAVFGLWQPNTMMGSGRKDEHGSWAWTELTTPDLDGSATFYTSLFGWQPAPSAVGSSEYREMKVGDSSVAGLMARPAMMPDEVPNYWGIYFTVDSLDEAVAYLNANGAEILVGPMAIDPGTFLQFRDPQGAVVGLLEPKSS